jgi:hypothetical protein
VAGDDADERTALLEGTLAGTEAGADAETVVDRVLTACVPPSLRDDVAVLAAADGLSDIRMEHRTRVPSGSVPPVRAHRSPPVGPCAQRPFTDRNRPFAVPAPARNRDDTRLG